MDSFLSALDGSHTGAAGKTGGAAIAQRPSAAVELTGVVGDITFQNENTGFTVLRLEDEHSGATHVCVGIIPAAQKGETVKIKGEKTFSPKFGPQINVTSYEFSRPVTLKGISLLLGSGLFPNIGPSRAAKIVGVFGAETLNILDHHPERLLEVGGIGKKRLSAITVGWQRQRHVRDLLLYLQQFGVSVNLVYKIFRAWGEHAKEKISANPYALIDDIWGVGFKKADAVARHLGFAPDSYRRIRAGLIFLLQEASGDGHVYLPGSDIVDCGEKLLEVKREAVQYSLDHMVIENTVVNDNERIYLPLLHKVETSVAQMLRERVSGCNDASALQSANIDEWIARYRSRTKWEPDSRQVEAVKAAVKSRILLITGGPGTGKTTTLQVIVSFFRERQVTIALAAPTGRAAQRMGSIAGIDASTIHRLLEYRPNQSGSFFAKNAGNPIAAGVVIIDESSMIDIRLMHSLLCAVPKNAVLIFVGDSNQLPSVGPGNVLADMISCGALPHARLTHIFRQAARSRIVTAAHEIINGTVPHFINAAGDNCFFMIKETPEECRNTVIELAESRLPKKYGFDPVRDIQVLSPMHRGELGTQAFNRLLQEKLNPSGKRLTRGETSYAVGDKVMQVRNNYDKSVFNGDIGFITSISDESVITVDFGGMRVEYEFSELDELTHAYCISIHKSQGCEFRAVVIPVMTQHYIMLQKNLLYTAVTRARELCIIVGMPRALKAAVSNDSGLNRNSGLAGRITSARL